MKTPSVPNGNDNPRVTLDSPKSFEEWLQQTNDSIEQPTYLGGIDEEHREIRMEEE
jgi:hypothetical protein